MVTRHPVVGQFGSEFLTICNTVWLWRPGVTRVGNFVSSFWAFSLEKRPLTV